MSFIEKAIELAKSSRQQDERDPRSELEKLLEDQPLPDLEEEFSHPQEIKDVVYSLTKTVPIEMENMIRNRLMTGGANPEVEQSYKLLRTHILQKTYAQNHNVLMITSPMPEEGKTLTSINLGHQPLPRTFPDRVAGGSGFALSLHTPLFRFRGGARPGGLSGREGFNPRASGPPPRALTVW